MFGIDILKANACKWAHLAMNGQNPHLTETYTDDDLGKFENLQAFEDFYSGHDTEHVPYHRPENILPVKSNADL